MKKNAEILLILFFVMVLISYTSNANAEDKPFSTCSTCEECTDLARSENVRIKLINDLYYSGGNEACVKIQASGVHFDGNGFTITSGANGSAIQVYDECGWPSNVTITNVNVEMMIDFIWYGIILYNCDHCTITSNNFNIGPLPIPHVIYLYNTTNTFITYNTITSADTYSHSPYGILLSEDSNGNTIDHNTIDMGLTRRGGGGEPVGIALEEGSSNNNISNNKISNVWKAIQLGEGSDNNIMGNTIEGSLLNAIFLMWDTFPGNKIYNNTIRNNNAGIQTTERHQTAYHKIKGNQIINNDIGILIAGNSSDFEIASNIIKNNNDKGLVLGNCYAITGYSIFNNLFENKLNVFFNEICPGGNNQWNNPEPIEGPNIVGGPYIAGNVWLTLPSNKETSYTKSFSVVCPDSDADEICDEEYRIDEFNRDYMPLKIPIPH